MTQKRLSKIVPIYAENLAGIPWLLHAFSTRLGGLSSIYGAGCLNLGFTPKDSRTAVERNRKAFLRVIGALRGKQFWPLVTLRQIHSDIIHCIADVPKVQLIGDGLITRTPELLLGIQTADCLPVILVDTKSRAVGVFHAGWEGTLKRIVEKGVGEMRRWFGTRPRDIQAAIGPGIQGCCYSIGPEVQERYTSQFDYAAKLFRETKESDPVREKYPLLFMSARPPGHSDLPKKIFLNLHEANRRQLVSTSVPAGNITVSSLCTSCRTDLFFSYRAEKKTTGRMMAVAGMRKVQV